MEGIETPQSFINAMKNEGLNLTTLVVEPPAGVSREHCVPAHCARTNDWEDDGMGSAFIMFFEPNEDEKRKIVLGCPIKLTLRGSGLVPHAISIW